MSLLKRSLASWCKIAAIVLRIVATAVLAAAYAQLPRWGVVAWLVGGMLVAEFGRNFPRISTRNRRSLSSVMFAYLTLFALVAALIPLPTPILMVTMVCSLLAWDLDSVYVRFSAAHADKDANTVIIRHIIALILLVAATIAVYVIATQTTLVLSTWGNLAIAAFAVTALLSIINRIRREFRNQSSQPKAS